MQLIRQHRVLTTVVVLLAIGAAAVLAARPLSHRIKAWQARRHADKAYALIAHQKWNEAGREAIAGYRIWPKEPEAVRAVARYLSRTNQPEGLQFWERLAAMARLGPEDLRDQADLALKLGETARAEQAVQALLSQPAPGPADRLLAAQAAVQKGASDDAREDFKTVLDNPQAGERERLQAAMHWLDMINRSANDPARAEADARFIWPRIEALAKGRTPAALDALMLLARQILSPAGAPDGLTLSDLELSRVIEQHPLAETPHKLVALDLAEHNDPTLRDTLVQRAINQWQSGNPAQLSALARWLNSKGLYQRNLDSISLEQALQNGDLFLQHLDALAGLGRWEETKALLDSERFPLDPTVVSMYLARCSAQLDQTTAATNNWQRALESASSNTGKLMMLADYAEKNGNVPIAETAYTRVAATLPTARAAQQGRLRIAQASRDLAKIHTVLADMLGIWPNDTAVQNDEAYTRLLLLPGGATSAAPKGSTEKSDVGDQKPDGGEQKSDGGSTAVAPTNQQPMTDNRGELAAIGETASRLVAREPASLPHRTLLALALLKQNRAPDALAVYEKLQIAPQALTPSALAIHAAVLGATGHFDDARTEAAQIPKEKLLPEERALIASLL